MARKTENKAADNFKEFNITATNKNDFRGRIYKDAKAYDKGTSYGVSITINGVTIKGVKLWVPKEENKDCSFMWPSYKGSDGKYNDYIAFFEDSDKADVTELANKLAEMI